MALVHKIVEAWECILEELGARERVDATGRVELIFPHP